MMICLALILLLRSSNLPASLELVTLPCVNTIPRACRLNSARSKRRHVLKYVSLEATTQCLKMQASRRDAYLVLLLTGFTMPLLLPAKRCALTAPFHPYHYWRYIFCGTFLKVSPTGCYPALIYYGVRTFLRHKCLPSSCYLGCRL